jgi:acetyl-CoA carboxylase biotin carboxylase subunit
MRFEKIMVANRGEIAIRIMRAARELGIEPVMVYSEADRGSLHVRLSREAHLIGPPPPSESYLRSEVLVETALSSGCQAIHPGYGFLAENADFAQMCCDAGLVFVGPSPEAMRRMGDKLEARRIAAQAGVPTVPGTTSAAGSAEEAAKAAREIGYPVLLKAAMGGGGKGMRLVSGERELREGYALAAQEAKSAFGDGTLYIEKYLERPRHVEIQVVADAQDNVVHFGERECSIQRRHQKLVEESPSLALDEQLRARMGSAAVSIARAGGYTNAGTVEFMVDGDRHFYFLEVNARLQVEHPVTEMVTGVDLARLQLRVAQGESLPFSQADVVWSGAAIEWRVYAEDPDNNFAPSAGRVEVLREPGGPWVRVDSGMFQGCDVPIYYDPLLAKLIVWGKDRDEAIARSRRALGEYKVVGVRTTIPFHCRVLEDRRFADGELDTHFIEGMRASARPISDVLPMVAAVMHHRHSATALSSAVSGALQNPWKMAGRREGLRTP